ncbi:MAG: ADP-dependent glucokinase/phosphofructokinase [Naasia sp.]
MGSELVLGLGGTVDYEIRWDGSVVERLIDQYGIDAAELTRGHGFIEDERALVVALLGYLRDGSGGERFTASSEISTGFATHFEYEVTLGGTGVRAGLAMLRLGIGTLQHLVSIDDDVRRLLPPEMPYICSADSDTTDPHVIVQYAAGTRIRARDIDITAPHPNRVIFTNDPPNRDLVLSVELEEALRSADVFLVSGFNSIQEPAVLENRLDEIARLIGTLPATAVTYYEDGGFHVPAFSPQARDRMASVTDVYSLNEDEMQAYLGRDIDLLDVTEVSRALADLRTLIPVRILVVHTKYWSLALGAEAAAWREALVGGITMASTRYLHGDAFTKADYDASHDLPQHTGGAAVVQALQAEFGDELSGVAAFVLTTDRPTTIGLGDTFVGGFIAALSRSTAPIRNLSPRR